MVISVPVSDVFRYPSDDSEHIDEVMFGTDVEVTDTMCGFVKITTEYRYSGWINEHDISVKLAEPNRIILLPWADLLKDDRNFYAPVMTLPLGSKVDAGYSEQFKRHAFVVLPDKRMFYIRKEVLGDIPDGADEEKARKTICDTALSFLGIQYRWGGRTHKGIDCSGLAFTSYRMAGINIWRDADPDKTPGLKKITLNKAKPGDILFFEGHMAVYLGDKNFIHASSGAARVTIASFNPESSNYSEWCAQNLICAGTVF